MENVVSKLYGAAGKKFVALRKKDPVRNLRERFAKLVKVRPEVAPQLGYLRMLIDPGWAVVAVPEDAVAYTIGLHYHFGQKELLISAPHLELEAQKRLLNELARRVIIEGERFDDGARLTINPTDDGREKVNATFRAFRDETFDKYPCGYLARFEELFEDRFHTAGGTLPILWAKISPTKARRATKTSRSSSGRARRAS